MRALSVDGRTPVTFHLKGVTSNFRVKGTNDKSREWKRNNHQHSKQTNKLQLFLKPKALEIITLQETGSQDTVIVLTSPL